MDGSLLYIARRIEIWNVNNREPVFEGGWGETLRILTSKRLILQTEITRSIELV